jgi:hypothetical protein
MKYTMLIVTVSGLLMLLGQAAQGQNGLRPGAMNAYQPGAGATDFGSPAALGIRSRAVAYAAANEGRLFDTPLSVALAPPSRASLVGPLAPSGVGPPITAGAEVGPMLPAPSVGAPVLSGAAPQIPGAAVATLVRPGRLVESAGLPGPSGGTTTPLGILGGLDGSKLSTYGPGRLGPGPFYGGSVAGTPAGAYHSATMAAGLPKPVNIGGKGIYAGTQPGPNTRIGAGIGNDLGDLGVRVGALINAGGEVGAGYGTNEKTRWFRYGPGTGAFVGGPGRISRAP